MNDDHGRDDLAAKGKAIVASGKYAPPRGELLGTITAWGLPVYEGSPQPWKDALYQEQESAC
jgi:hypothetical protein